jgi:hypothetical protein
VWIDVWRKIDVRPADMQEAVRISPRQLAGLVAVHHVIRNRGYLWCQLGLGANSVKRMESH